MSLQKKCILVPTPGQTEQEYLAEYLSEKKMCLTTHQKKFFLSEALYKAQNFSYHFYEPGYGLDKRIERFLNALDPPDRKTTNVING